MVTQKGKTTPKAIAGVFAISAAKHDPAHLLALLRTGGAKAQATLARSADSGLTFTPITIPGFTPLIVQRTHVSRGGGRTFTRELDG